MLFLSNLFAGVTKRAMLSQRKNICDKHDPFNAKNHKVFITETQINREAKM